jgi:hypothetical protein
MTTKEQQDTDPSTPGALRGLAPTDPTPTPMPASAHVSTDPGVGPPSRPPIPPVAPVHRTPPMGIVVPASSPVKPKKDSVELLLEGMQGPQPERPKTMPQTDGQSSASYHAEHMVRPARTSPVVERPLQAPTKRIDRTRVQAVIDEADARRRAMEATAVLPQQIAPRVVVAIVAGVVVVLGLFVVLRLTMGGHAEAVAPAASVAAIPENVAPPVAPVVAPAATVVATPPTEVASAEPAAPPAPADTATTASRPTATPPWAASPSTAKPKVPRAAPAGTSADIGEFKTTFH